MELEDDLIVDLRKSSVQKPERCISTAEISIAKFKKFIDSKNSKGHIFSNLIKSKKQEDTDLHIDYFVNVYIPENNETRKLSFDLKSEKKFFENPDMKLSKEWIWVELVNVDGNDGWLYGKATHLAYVFGKDIWLINLERLVKYVESVVIREFVEDKNDLEKDQKYHLYQRQPWQGKVRKDVLTKILLKDVAKKLNPMRYKFEN
jgi:hypothetical protein